jgi:hypothetical protein
MEAEFAADAGLYAWVIHHCPLVSSPKGNAFLAGHGITMECANHFKLRELTNPQTIFGRLLERWGAQRVYRSGLAWGKDGIPEHLIWGTPALLLPFHRSGSVIYMQARMFEGNRKYLNPRGIAKPLFNLDRLTGLPAASLVHICEGVPDTLALEAHGLNAVGVLGATSFRPEWMDHFLKFNLEVLGQGDAAGEKFAADISLLFRTRGKSVRCKRLPAGKDAAKRLITVAERRTLKVATFSQKQVRRVFFGDAGGTKHALAEIMAERFPEELGFRLPPKRRPWMSEDSRMDIFDAVSLALSYCSQLR